jgi:predicted Zn-dependent protease
MEIASFLDPEEGNPGLEKSKSAKDAKSFFPETDQYPPARRAEAVAAIANMANAEGLQSSGLCQLQTNRIAVVNSAGTSQYHEDTVAELSVSAADDATLGQGWSAGVNHDIGKLDAAGLGRIAVDKAMRSRNPELLPPGDYTVILEPAAVGQLLLFLGFLAFSGKSFAQGRGVLSGRIGETVTGENITIIEDPFLPEFPGVPFDYEGVPKKKVTLIEKGVAKGVVHDRRSAAMARTKSTGHALPPDNARGPYPKNMTLLPGDATLDEMIASTPRGILITHFWYVNYLNPMRAQVTASTRDGTFLIEDGKISKPVQNLRATPAILESLAQVEQIGRERVLYPQYSVVMSVPALKVASMPFAENEG